MPRIPILLGMLTIALSSLAVAGDSYRERRMQMVTEQIAARGVEDETVLRAMRTVQRHHFVPEPLRDQAYTDRPLPIGREQTISQPYIVAFMTEALDLRPHHRVYELGTGSGYQAAVLAEIVEEVYTVEIVSELARRADRTLEELGYDNVHVRAGDGWAGWPEAAPFDRIIVTAAAPELPQTLLDQLVAGGKMILPLGPDGGAQELILVEKTEDGRVKTRELLPVRFVPVTRDPR